MLVVLWLVTVASPRTETSAREGTELVSLIRDLGLIWKRAVPSTVRSWLLTITGSAAGSMP